MNTIILHVINSEVVSECAVKLGKLFCLGFDLIFVVVVVVLFVVFILTVGLISRSLDISWW